MKKSGILNADLARVVAARHGDVLIIGDAGLPVPAGVRCIDLAVTLGVPDTLSVLDAGLDETCVQNAFRAREAGAIAREIDARLPCETIPHDSFKNRCTHALAVVRTGEGTPYATVGLVGGVMF